MHACMYVCMCCTQVRLRLCAEDLAADGREGGAPGSFLGQRVLDLLASDGVDLDTFSPFAYQVPHM